MAKSGRKAQRKSTKDSRERALNAFDTAVYDDYYIKGLRHQQDIDLDHISDDRIRELMSNQVNSEDDEDIDSDEAMGSGSDISLGEPESDDEDKWGDSYDEEELRPLSEIWDLDEENGSENKPAKKSSDKQSVSQAGSESEDESGDESETGDDSESNSESESGSESDLDDDSDANSLSLSDSGSDDEDEGNTDALRKAVKSVGGHQDLRVSNNKLMEADTENPFAIPTASSGGTLTLEDLGAGATKAKPLAVPAPKRVQERADRGAAYKLAKDEVNKWNDTVQANRQAEHLQFPINAPSVELKSASPFESSADRNDLESKVSSILQTSQLEDEKAASTFEEMEAAKLSIDDVRKRRDQLRYMRELMFREEQKAKRIKKIKSKKYRKIHKKERERMAELENGSDPEADADDVEKAERARALERATLRHKNNSKWAKQMLEHGLTRDSGTRAEMEEMLRQSDALRQKVRGNDNEYSDDELDDGFADQDEQQDEEAPRKGVLGMKFMRDAEDRQRAANQRALKDDYDSDSEEENIGRKSFNPAGQQLKRDRAEMQRVDSDDDEPSSNKLTKSSRPSKKLERGDESVEFRPAPASEDKTAVKQPAPTDSENPWIKASMDSKTPGMLKLAPSSRNEKQGKRSNDNIAVENTFGDRLVRQQDMTLQQQDMVREAFAGDDVVAEFNAAKQAEIDEDKDQEIDETLPGWGSWSNEKPRMQKIRKVAGINEKQRRDYKKSNVIINEKVNKKNAKYNASAVPFPFENRQQYERSLRMPIGQEWVTKDTFQRQTKPRVLVKRGTVIDPIKKPKSH